MDTNSVKLIFFSPTRTTEKILKGIAAGIQCTSIEQVDLTYPDSETGHLDKLHDEMAILGVPVYSGRVPIVASERLKQIKVKNCPAIVVVLYGNREYEDALLELSDIASNSGFKVVAGGAFIGEHSFSNDETLIANGRPDNKDLEQAKEFGKKIKNKMQGISSPSEVAELHLPGDFPYKKRPGMPKVTPVTNESLCTICGECVPVCPVGAITIGSALLTDQELCIHCCACVKICPENARVWEEPRVLEIASWLSKNYSIRKEPEIFI